MKTLFILLLIGAIAGAMGWQYYERKQHPTLGQRAADLTERSRQAAIDAKDVVAAKVKEWNLTPENIGEELAKTGSVIRSRAMAVGERMDDVRIVTVIKGKYVMEKNLSSFTISVESQDGEVKLTGSVSSADQIGQAVGLALQTSGVHRVVSQLAVKI